MDDNMEMTDMDMTEMIILILTGVILGVALTTCGLRAGSFLLEILDMELEMSKVVASFFGFSALSLFLLYVLSYAMRRCMRILLKRRKRRKELKKNV